MKNGLLNSAIAIIGCLSTLPAFAASDAVIPSGFTVTEPVPGSVVKEISKVSFKSSTYQYFTLDQNVKIQINGVDVESTSVLSGSAKSIVTYTLASPITEAGEYEIVIPQGAVSYTRFGDTNKSGQFKFSVTIADDTYVPTETTIPSGFKVSPAADSEVESIAELKITTDYMNIVAGSESNIKIDGENVKVTAAVSGTYSDVLTLTLDTPVTAKGTHPILIPSGFFTYDTYSSNGNPSGIFYYNLVIGKGGNDDPTPDTPAIPDNFSVTPLPGAEVDSIAEIIIESMLYEGMEVYQGKTILIDGKDVEITSKKLDNWGSKLGITLTNPIKESGVHTIKIPAGTFKYNKMFDGSSDNAEFNYTLIVANSEPDTPDPVTPTIIIEQPAGELKTFDRTGNYYYANQGYLRTGTQTGTVDIVFADDKKVYIKDPINNLALGSWVMGTLNEEGTTITVKLGQYLYEDAEHGFVTLQMVEYNDDEEWFDPISTEEITYTVDGDIISLNGTYRKGKCLGVVWETANEWAGNADYGTKYAPVTVIEPVEVPEDITLNTYKFKGIGYGGTELEYTVNVGFVENDMYIQGIFADTPRGWIKGTVEGDTVTFKSPQFLGNAAFDNKRELFMVATALDNTYDIIDLKLVYDKENDCYTNSDQYLVLNTSKHTVYMLEAINQFSLNRISTNGVYSIPYSDTFGSNASLNDYTLIDANSDGNGWYFSRGMMSYDFCPNKADDWLITPAIALEAGKTYKFSLMARSFASSNPERFEVKMGNAATVEAMTTDVIAPTVIASDTMTPFSGEVTVKESGNYHFGIHAISDPDEFTLSIDNISVDEASGVNSVYTESEAGNGMIYTIDGRIVTNEGQLSPGIYIRNGEKIMVK